MSEIIAEKLCTKCDKKKPETDFHLRLKGSTVRRNVCKDCERIQRHKNWKPIPTPKPVKLIGKKKKCRGCQKSRDLAFYDRSRTAADGHLNHCKTCRYRANKAYILAQGTPNGAKKDAK